MKPPCPPPVPALDQDCGIPWWGIPCSPGHRQRCVVTPGWPWEGGRDLEATASLPGKGGGRGGPAVLVAPHSSSTPHPVLSFAPTQFLQFRMKIINLKLERFRDRVEFSGNPSKYDVSVTLRKVQLEDEGTYNCYIMNPPDRHRGHGKIYLQVLMEGERLLGGPAGSQPTTLQHG